MSKEREILYTCERCKNCKEDCKQKSSVKGADVISCKKDSKIDSKKDKKKK